MKNQYPYRGIGDERYQKPDSNGQTVNPYDLDSKLFQELAQTKRAAYFVVPNINLTTAGSLSIPKAGFHFVIFGHDGSAIKTVNTTAYVSAQVNTQYDTGDAGFPAKHARGFSGPFSGLYISWPAQNNVYCDLVIYFNPDKPWIDGESCT